MKKNIVRKKYQLSAAERQARNKHHSFVVWFTGLSGSGKSTIANAVEIALFNQGINTYCIDGDNLRNGLNKDLGFSKQDRHENIRRAAETAKLLSDAGLVVLAAFITPSADSRSMTKEIIGSSNYIEIFVDSSLETCEKRDVKGLYKKARNGEISDMTGISSPYELPNHPDLVIDSENLTVQESTNLVLKHIEAKLPLEA